MYIFIHVFVLYRHKQLTINDINKMLSAVENGPTISEMIYCIAIIEAVKKNKTTSECCAASIHSILDNAKSQ